MQLRDLGAPERLVPLCKLALLEQVVPAVANLVHVVGFQHLGIFHQLGRVLI